MLNLKKNKNKNKSIKKVLDLLKVKQIFINQTL